MKYQVHSHELGSSVHDVESDLWIPMDKANTDYQAYLAWLAEGNEPEVIDLSG